jgi:hypothetical protein
MMPIELPRGTVERDVLQGGEQLDGRRPECGEQPFQQRGTPLVRDPVGLGTPATSMAFIRRGS